MDEDNLLVKILAGELHYTKLWLVCVALRGVSWDKTPFEQRELAFQAKDAASTVVVPTLVLLLSVLLKNESDKNAS